MTALSVGLAVVAHPQWASACGGCFLPPTSAEPSIVTAHRMAFAISPTRTVLWDQIQYAGDPADFSWVLPVRGDATLEASDDAWFEALEAVTATRVSPAQLNCLNRSTKRGGCSCVGMSSDDLSVNSAGGAGPNVLTGVNVTHEGTVGPYAYVQLQASSTASLATWLPANGYALPADIVPVVDAYVKEQFDFIALKLRPGIGTRQMTPVRVITQGATPTLPLRMVAAGTGASVGITLYVISESRFATSGFTQATISPAQLTFDWQAQKSNYGQLRAEALASANGFTWLTSFAARGALTRTWQDALGTPISFAATSTARPGERIQADHLTELYFAQAAANANKPNTCSSVGNQLAAAGKARVVDACVLAAGTDGGGALEAARDDSAPGRADEAASRVDATAVATDGAGADATSDDGRGGDGASEGSTVVDAAQDRVVADAVVDSAIGDARGDRTTGTNPPTPGAVIPKPERKCGSVRAGEMASSALECGGFTDIAAATIGMHVADIWITRLEANLPRSALAGDLALKSAADQTEISNALRATKHLNPPCELVEDHPLEAALQSQTPDRSPVGHASLGFLSALGLLVARRLSRKSA